MPTQEEVYEVLRTCYDPEIPVNIVDLGLIYDVQIAKQKVDVKMTLTARGCGMGGYIASEAEQKILELPDVQEAKVEVVWDPPWEPSMISPEARKMLGMPEDE
jgi:metal-sulfur cluster biosynthetic enzyme